MFLFYIKKIDTLLSSLSFDLGEGLCFVRMEGLEPPCFAALDPKSSASTNFATSAFIKKLFFILDKIKNANLIKNVLMTYKKKKT